MLTIKGKLGCNGKHNRLFRRCRASDASWLRLTNGSLGSGESLEAPSFTGGQSKANSVRVGVPALPSEDTCESDELKDRWKRQHKDVRRVRGGGRGGWEFGEGEAEREATERWKAANAANCGFESSALLLNYSSPSPSSLSYLRRKQQNETEKRCTWAGLIICQANRHAVGQRQRPRMITLFKTL